MYYSSVVLYNGQCTEEEPRLLMSVSTLASLWSLCVSVNELQSSCKMLTGTIRTVRDWGPRTATSVDFHAAPELRDADVRVCNMLVGAVTEEAPCLLVSVSSLIPPPCFSD